MIISPMTMKSKLDLQEYNTEFIPIFRGIQYDIHICAFTLIQYMIHIVFASIYYGMCAVFMGNE